MDIVEEAKAEMESGIVAYMEFSLDFNKEKKIIYCFYEGYEDRSFYSHRVKNYFTDYKYFDYISIGKGNLVKVNQLIENHSQYKSSTIGFFVDKDFESIIPNKNIFTTQTYSIENLFVSSETFCSILLNEFAISHRHDDYMICQKIFSDLKLDFLHKSLLLNAWLSCQTDLRIEKGLNTRLNIDNTIKVLLDKTVKSDLTGINFPEQLTSKENIENLFSTAEKISDEILHNKIHEFSKINLEMYTRGKFLIKFLTCFLNRLKDEIGKNKSPLFKNKFTCRLRFEYVTSVSQLTNNVNTPRALIDYFEFIEKLS
jgi:hypothetical protein